MAEATALSELILNNIELSEIPLSSITLRVARLCRLLGLDEIRKLFEYEVSGYPQTPTGITPEVWKLAKLAGRTVRQKQEATSEIKEFAYTDSIDTLEEQIRSSNIALNVAQDPNISVSSTNPYQTVFNPIGNKRERTQLLTTISTATKRLAERKAFIYKFVSERYIELKFSNQVSDFFTSSRREVDERLTKYLPEATEKLSSIIENLRSENSEDWSNAVHSCRRLLQAIADRVFPPMTEVRIKGKKTISLGPDQFINRLICFVEDQSDSSIFEKIVGSNLDYLGNRLDAIFSASQKGSHKNITKRSEAERYVVYTYMILGDILLLADSAKATSPVVSEEAVLLKENSEATKQRKVQIQEHS